MAVQPAVHVVAHNIRAKETKNALRIWFGILDGKSQNQVIKLRKIWWERHVARMGEKRETYGVWLERLKEGDSFEHLGVD
jgi:hypothetical protein